MLTEESRRGELHQRARRRRHDPLPAQRDGPVAAAGVPARLARAPTTSPPLLRRGGRRAGVRRGRRRRRPGVPPAGRHAGPHRATPAARLGQPCRRAARPTVRCILDSLALAHRRAVRAGAASCPAATVDVVHVVGGGARNELLCQLTADACGLPVVAGPVEATALGNVLVQARALGAVAATSPPCAHCSSGPRSSRPTSRAATKPPGRRPNAGYTDKGLGRSRAVHPESEEPQTRGWPPLPREKGPSAGGGQAAGRSSDSISGVPAVTGMRRAPLPEWAPATRTVSTPAS